MLYGWKEPLHEEALARRPRAFSDLKCVEKRHVCLRSFRCIDCPSLPIALDSALADAPEKKISLSHMARRVRAQMLNAEDCQRCGECPERFSVSLLRIAFARSATAAKGFRLVKGELWSRDHWRTTKGPISTLLESVLKGHPGPMSYREDPCLQVSQTRRDKAAPTWCRHALSRQGPSGNGHSALGSRRYVPAQVPRQSRTPLLNKIEKWVLGVLTEGPFTQLSTNAAFQAFREDCLAAGLTSEYAVHSCLKHRQHPKLAFFKSPYVALAGAAKTACPTWKLQRN